MLHEVKNAEMGSNMVVLVSAEFVIFRSLPIITRTKIARVVANAQI